MATQDLAYLCPVRRPARSCVDQFARLTEKRRANRRRHQQAGDEPVGSLEDSGYLLRDDAPEEGGGRVVHFTRRGHAAYERVHDILRNVEQEWTAALGAEDFAQLRSLLARVWDSRLVN